MDRESFNVFSVVRYFTTFVFSIVEILLFFRFFLKLFGASMVSEFVVWVYSTTYPLVNPFLGIFPEPNLEGPFVLEFGTLFATIVYVLIYWGVIELINFFQRLAIEAKEA